MHVLNVRIATLRCSPMRYNCSCGEVVEQILRGKLHVVRMHIRRLVRHLNLLLLFDKNVRTLLLK